MPRQGETMHRLITTLVLLLTSAYSWGQATVGFGASSFTFTPAGEVETLELQGSGWNSDDLVGGGVDLTISNTSALTLQSVTIDPTVFDLNCFNPGSCASSSSGVINLQFNQLFDNPAGGPGTTGAFNIAAFSFLVTNSNACTTANPCITDLNLSTGCDCNAFTDSAGNSPTFNFQDATVTVESGVVASVPEIEPASALSALALLLGSLAVLFGRRAVSKRA
jgi:hypothetical protein